MSLSRREFLRLSCCAASGAALATGIGRFGLVNAYAQGMNDYKALVCIFLFGGNDGNNLVIPFDGYSNYAALRTPVLALPQNAILPITPPSAGAQYALHPRLAGIQSLFNGQHLAIVNNVGMLVKPTTRAQYQNRQVPIPANLFSHSDQQAQFQTAVTSGVSSTGWGGRTADKIVGLNAPATYPAIISVAGSNIFSTGVDTAPSVVIPGSSSGLNGISPSSARYTAMQQLLTFDTGLSLVQAASGIMTQAFANSTALANALATGTPLATVFPNSGIGSQLKQVAQIIQVRAALNLHRQIFFCSMGGYDTHTNQIIDQDSLLNQLNAGMLAFYNATVEIGVAPMVTTFTLSDFGRTLQPASGAGSDHGWGSHHFVMGGAVKGGDFYGTYPTLALGGPDDTGNAGRWIPTISLDQYAATLASWFGVSDVDLASIFPNLVNFSSPKLAFMM